MVLVFGCSVGVLEGLGFSDGYLSVFYDRLALDFILFIVDPSVVEVVGYCCCIWRDGLIEVLYSDSFSKHYY